MAYYDALITYWATLSGTLDDKLAAINSGTISGPNRLVSRGAIRQHFDNQVDGSGVPIWKGIEAHQTDQSALGIACWAAIRLRDAPGDYPAIDVEATMFSSSIAELVTGGLLTSDQQASTMALAATTIPLWQSLGLTSIVTQPDLDAAGITQ